jgi:hypothetical protein
MRRAILIIMAVFVFHGLVNANQLQPDGKRLKQIQSALVSHGYQPGKTWTETQDILRQIARDHRWQVLHAPDARVLILLGLGNKDSDPDVLNAPPNHLDGPQ